MGIRTLPSIDSVKIPKKIVDSTRAHDLPWPFLTDIHHHRPAAMRAPMIVLPAEVPPDCDAWSADRPRLTMNCCRLLSISDCIMTSTRADRMAMPAPALMSMTALSIVGGRVTGAGA